MLVESPGEGLLGGATATGGHTAAGTWQLLADDPAASTTRPHSTHHTRADGQRALLGRSAKSTPGMYTCLSGFIDQCEGIEEAVRGCGAPGKGGGADSACAAACGGRQVMVPAACLNRSCLLGRGARRRCGLTPRHPCPRQVRREVMEEARISVSDVHILGTQPWPIGRYG